MPGFFDQIKSLFTKSGSKQDALIHEVLRRDQDWLKSYEDWCGGSSSLLPIRAVLSDTIEARQGDFSTITFSNDKGGGLQINFEAEKWTPSAFQYSFEWLKDRCLSLDYRITNADRRQWVENDKVQLIERYYLKPNIRLPLINGKRNQLHGNLTLEHCLEDDKPLKLSLLANIYQDRLFVEAGSFIKLIQKIENTD